MIFVCAKMNVVEPSLDDEIGMTEICEVTSVELLGFIRELFYVYGAKFNVDQCYLIDRRCPRCIRRVKWISVLSNRLKKWKNKKNSGYCTLDNIFCFGFS